MLLKMVFLLINRGFAQKLLVQKYGRGLYYQ